jgi:hypothetical protein
MSKKPVIQPQDKYVLRMPDGLRDRIKLYAERQGTSMNHEIIRVLDREFPEQWPVDDRLSQLAEMLDILSAGRGDPRLDTFVEKFRETVDGIVSGRVTGVDAETRESVRGMWQDYRSRAMEAAFEEEEYSQLEYTPQELEAKELTGSYEKYAVPPPKRPDPMKDNFHLMDILPRGPLSEIAEKLEKADTEGAAEILRKIPKTEIEQRLRFLELPQIEQERRHLDPDEVTPPPPNYSPFKRSE